MAEQNPTRARRATPRAGTRQSVRITDQQTADDIAVLMTTGCDLSAAVRTAVSIVATMYRTAWTHGVVPVGTAPTLREFRFAERPPVPGPFRLPWVTADGPTWSGSSLASIDDTGEQTPPTSNAAVSTSA
ncbi:hypothetical protein ACFWGL_17065 [Streptomyces sp. NPDC060286]|uniref:hypothetical protein n=1 Tax=unclassified Streptomyces TaxID=2593676 RepID=UPI0035DC2C05